MKNIISLFLILFSIMFIGCGDALQQPVDTSSYEKRTPIKRDSIKVKVTVEGVLPCLNLTREQRFIIDSILKVNKECSIECKKEFNESVNIIREQYNSKLSDYRGKEKDSLIRKEVEIIKYEFRQILKDLEAEYKLKIKECNAILVADIEKYLTPEQIILWNTWKETGKIPCERKKS